MYKNELLFVKQLKAQKKAWRPAVKYVIITFKKSSFSRPRNWRAESEDGEDI